MRETHAVFNQPRPLVDYNLFDGNRPLRDALKFNAPGLDFAAAIRSFNVDQLRCGGTSSTLGNSASVVTAEKSLTGSNGRLL